MEYRLVYQGRIIHRNPPMCDGTPRTEKGYRAHLKYSVMKGDRRVDWFQNLWEGPYNVYATSPLFATEANSRDVDLPRCG